MPEQTPYFWYKGAAQVDFDVAFRKGFWRAVISWFTKSDNKLLPFDEVKKRLRFRGQHSIGLKDVPLENVVGSVGRYRDFDKAFLPRQKFTRGRWMSVDEAHLKDISLPAIELYKIGSDYFVRDGNHRVSVARERGQKFIDAHVIEIEVDERFDEGADLIEMMRRRELSIFLEKTKLENKVKDSNIKITMAGGYDKLLEHIQVHRWYMGEQLSQNVVWEDAVEDWYNQVYLPLVKVIRENKIMKNFPERTEADLYLWIIEHLWYLREEFQKDVSLESAASHFADEYSQRPLHQIFKLISKLSEVFAVDSGEDKPPRA
ncbi:MAG: DUF4032 domain-containing protein [Anaerolineaceae bacterium]|nr:DUF4032 domain-containing protein [Anaerolineaceae bacterium]